MDTREFTGPSRRNPWYSDNACLRKWVDHVRSITTVMPTARQIREFIPAARPHGMSFKRRHVDETLTSNADVYLPPGRPDSTATIQSSPEPCLWPCSDMNVHHVSHRAWARRRRGTDRTVVSLERPHQPPLGPKWPRHLARSACPHAECARMSRRKTSIPILLCFPMRR